MAAAAEELSCDICGAAQDDATLHSIGFRTNSHEDIPKLVKFYESGLKRGPDMPQICGPSILIQCPHHTEDETIRAGWMPPSVYKRLPDLVAVADARLRELPGE
jgi:hypothetical protein